MMQLAFLDQADEPIFVDPFVELPLTRGYVALIDAADAPLVLPYGWNANFNTPIPYAQAKINKVQWLLHRFLMRPPPGYQVDHRNRNRLDCRRANLRIATPTQNAFNKGSQSGSTSRFKGVHLSSKAVPRPWNTRANIGKRSTYIGCFASEEEAALAYDEFIRPIHGEFGRYNFPRPGEDSALGP